MDDLLSTLYKVNIPHEVIGKIYMMQVPIIKVPLKTELLQKQKLFYKIDTRIHYIKRYQRLMIKYRIRKKIKYYKDMNETIYL